MLRFCIAALKDICIMYIAWLHGKRRIVKYNIDTHMQVGHFVVNESPNKQYLNLHFNITKHMLFPNTYKIILLYQIQCSDIYTKQITNLYFM